MKKIIMLILISMLLTGCSFGNIVKTNKYIEINYNDLKTKLDNKETFILLIGSDTCSACAKFEETMNKVIKEEKIKVFYINLHNLSEDDYSKVYSKFVFQYTPTTIFVIDGEEKSTYDRMIGSVDYDVVIKNLKKQGYIGE